MDDEARLLRGFEPGCGRGFLKRVEDWRWSGGAPLLDRSAGPLR
jgi:hypothetical protein